jgi:hypothetical protein
MKRSVQKRREARRRATEGDFEGSFPSRGERRAAGRALRDKVPRESHAGGRNRPGLGVAVRGEEGELLRRIHLVDSSPGSAAQCPSNTKLSFLRMTSPAKCDTKQVRPSPRTNRIETGGVSGNNPDNPEKRFE